MPIMVEPKIWQKWITGYLRNRVWIFVNIAKSSPRSKNVILNYKSQCVSRGFYILKQHFLTEEVFTIKNNFVSSLLTAQIFHWFELQVSKNMTCILHDYRPPTEFRLIGMRKTHCFVGYKTQTRLSFMK